MIAITGASGHLGQALMRKLGTATPIGRDIPDQRFDIVIHAAAPSFRDQVEVTEFAHFNALLALHQQRHPASVFINISSWWVNANGEAATIPYTRLKSFQETLFPNATILIPYSIYGDQPIPGRGFIPHLVQHLCGGPRIKGLSDQPRDFIHVTDVANAVSHAITVAPGVYEIRTGKAESPRQIGERHGITAAEWPEYPSASPRYTYPLLPGWRASIHTDAYIRSRLQDQGVHPT